MTTVYNNNNNNNIYSFSRCYSIYTINIQENVQSVFTIREYRIIRIRMTTVSDLFGYINLDLTEYLLNADDAVLKNSVTSEV